MISDLRFLNGQIRESADVDNGTATLTIALVPHMRWFIAAILADYSAAPAVGHKQIQVTMNGSSVWTTRWNPALEMPFRLALPVDIHTHLSQTVGITVTLAASGTPTVTGRVGALVYLE